MQEETTAVGAWKIGLGVLWYVVSSHEEEKVMSLSRLSTASMLYVLEYMLKNEPHTLLQSNDLLAPMISRMEEVRELLLASRGEIPSALTPDEEREIRQALGALDQRHDQLHRTLFGLLSLAEKSASTSSYADNMVALREELYPFGMNIVRMKWVEEAGEAARLSNQLSEPSVQKQLGALRFSSEDTDTTALALAQDIAKVGEAMSEKLRQLTQLLEASRPNAEAQARRRFTKLMTRLTSLLEFEWEGAPKKVETVLKALNQQLLELPSTNNQTPPPETPSNEPPTDPASTNPTTTTPPTSSS